MEYKYLKKWVKEQDTTGLVCRNLGHYQDQYGLFFKKRKEFLQINLASEDSFCFFTNRHKDIFKEDKDLPQMNHILSGARVEGLELYADDRIISIALSKLDLTGNLKYYAIILELIPHFENIILVEKRDNGDLMILNSIKKFSLAENPQRQILPNVLYQRPLSQYQINSDEVSYPLAINEKGKITAVTENLGKFSVINILLKTLYYDHILERRLSRRRNAFSSNLKKEIAKNKRKLVKLEREFSDSDRMEYWQQMAELLKGNFSQIKPGMESIKIKNYYDEGFPEVEIGLKDDLSPQDNINFYFKKYRKARDGKKKIKEQIRLTKTAIKSLSDEIDAVMNLSAEELDDLKTKSKKKSQQIKSKYRLIAINDEWEIIVGRTSTENDYITTRLARSWDWWFHTRVFKGTHVILRNYKKKELPDQLKLICCQLAAYFSKAKKSTNVPVDYTEIRHVRKPRKSPPGYVIYTDQKTLYVDPISMREAVLKVNKFLEVREK